MSMLLNWKCVLFEVSEMYVYSSVDIEIEMDTVSYQCIPNKNRTIVEHVKAYLLRIGTISLPFLPQTKLTSKSMDMSSLGTVDLSEIYF